MVVQDLCQTSSFQIINAGSGLDREVSKIFCCDLLSMAMGRMPENAAWVTVMANINTLAVASLTDAACILLAEGAALDEPACNKAQAEGITVFSTDLPVFEAALLIHQRLYAAP